MGKYRVIGDVQLLSEKDNKDLKTILSKILTSDELAAILKKLNEA
ncbi:MAG: hypothetical protein WCD81_05570 [Candidatus Bathyarchaeia archaeon]